MASIERMKLGMCKTAEDLLQFTTKELLALRAEAEREIDLAQTSIELFDKLLAIKQRDNSGKE